MNDVLDPEPGLIRPGSLTVDASLAPERARQLVRIGQLLYTFWHTGQPAYLKRSVDDAFADNTLPPGRTPGVSGLLTASSAFREAVPDLACEVSEMLVVGDKIALRLRFTGTFNGVAGRGQRIDFIAFDIQLVGGDRIVEDWHLEDNLSFLQQAGTAS